MTRIGIGYANDSDAVKSGRSVAGQIAESGGLEHPDVILAFCNSAIDPARYITGLRSVFGSRVPIIGGSAIGIITADDLSYTGHPAGALALQSDSGTFRIATESGLDKSEFDTGRNLADALGIGDGDRNLLVFYDSVKQPPGPSSPPVMNSSAPLIQGMESVLGDTVSIYGAGLVGDYGFSPTVQFTGDGVHRQQVIGLMAGGDIGISCRIMHGCTPLDGIYHTITRKNGDVVYELDGEPIVPMIDAFYEHRDWRKELPVQLLSLGINLGERFSKPREENYVNRLILGALPDDSGIQLFESDLNEGSQVQFMLRDTREMIVSARRNATELLDNLSRGPEVPFAAVYINCAGRAAQTSNTPTEEAAEVQTACRKHGIPLFGFYTGVEIAPFFGKSRGLDWTGVLLVLTEKAPS